MFKKKKFADFKLVCFFEEKKLGYCDTLGVCVVVTKFKLGSHVPKSNMHVYTKSHNSDFNTYPECPFFNLKNPQTSIGVEIRLASSKSVNTGKYSAVQSRVFIWMVKTLVRLCVCAVSPESGTDVIHLKVGVSRVHLI